MIIQGPSSCCIGPLPAPLASIVMVRLVWWGWLLAHLLWVSLVYSARAPSKYYLLFWSSRHSTRPQGKGLRKNLVWASSWCKILDRILDHVYIEIFIFLVVLKENRRRRLLLWLIYMIVASLVWYLSHVVSLGRIAVHINCWWIRSLILSSGRSRSYWVIIDIIVWMAQISALHGIVMIFAWSNSFRLLSSSSIISHIYHRWLIRLS